MTEEGIKNQKRHGVDGPVGRVESNGGAAHGFWRPDHQGMTLRQYFAAHAPAEVPQWFSVEEAAIPPELTRREAVTIVCTQRGLPVSAEGVNHIANNMGDMWPEEDAPEGSPPDDDQSIAWAAVQLINERRELIQQMHHENRANRYFTWRWHYADTMIKIGGF